MFVHAPSGAAPFAACLRLFRSYPLAVNHSLPGQHRQHNQPGQPGEHSHPDRRGHPDRHGGLRSMVLRHPGHDDSGYYLLTEHPAERFTLRRWDAPLSEGQEITPGRLVPICCHRVIAEGMPVPRDGALLGWVSDRQATVLLSVYHGRPVEGPGVPQARALALVGSDLVRWPPFTASPLDDGRLWQYVARGEIVDLAPVLADGAGDTFWVPSQNGARAGLGHGCVVVNHNRTADDYWLPAGVYMDHWMLREGVPTPPASHLLTLPGVCLLSRRLPPERWSAVVL